MCDPSIPPSRTRSRHEAVHESNEALRVADRSIVGRSRQPGIGGWGVLGERAAVPILCGGTRFCAMSKLRRCARVLGMRRAHEGADERDHPSGRLMSRDGEPRLLEVIDDDGRREPQFAVDTFAEVPPIRLPHPDEIVDLDSDGLVLEKAGHDQVVRAAERYEAIQLSKLSAEIAKREDKPASGGETAGRALEYPVELFQTLEVGKRVAHARNDLDAGWSEGGDVSDVACHGGN